MVFKKISDFLSKLFPVLIFFNLCLAFYSSNLIAEQHTDQSYQLDQKDEFIKKELAYLFSSKEEIDHGKLSEDLLLEEMDFVHFVNYFFRQYESNNSLLDNERLDTYIRNYKDRFLFTYEYDNEYDKANNKIFPGEIFAKALECIYERKIQELILILESQDFLVYHRDINGNYLFHHALLIGDYDIVKLLLNYGFYTKEKNIFGDSPKDIAIRMNYKKIINLLKDRGF